MGIWVNLPRWSGCLTLVSSRSIRKNINVGIACFPSKDMEYLYYLANASLTLRIVEHLHGRPQMPLSFITVIHQIDGWVVKVKMKSPLNSQQDGDFRAFLNELGIPYEAPIRVRMALWVGSRTISGRRDAPLSSRNCLSRQPRTGRNRNISATICQGFGLLSRNFGLNRQQQNCRLKLKPEIEIGDRINQKQRISILVARVDNHRL